MAVRPEINTEKPVGERAEYSAANGHVMRTVEWHNGRRVQHNAEHADDLCACPGSANYDPENWW